MYRNFLEGGGAFSENIQKRSPNKKDIFENYKNNKIHIIELNSIKNILHVFQVCLNQVNLRKSHL